MKFNVQQQHFTKNGQSKPQPCVEKHWMGHNAFNETRSRNVQKECGHG
jgi:hypothetical protein